jgi:hypothetical protein
MYRYEITVGDGQKSFLLDHSPVAVAALKNESGIEFWAEHDEAEHSAHTSWKRTFFIVLGTGMTIRPGWVYVGTAPRTPSGLVWHLYETTRA